MLSLKNFLLPILIGGVILRGTLFPKVKNNFESVRFVHTTNTSPYSCLVLGQNTCDYFENGDEILHLSKRQGLKQLAQGAILLRANNENKALEIWSQTPSIGGYLTFLALNDDDPNRQKQLLQYGTQLYPSVLGFYNLGLILLQEKDYFNAENALLNALEISMEQDKLIRRDRVLINLGRTYFNLKDYEQSAEMYNQAIKLRPERATPWIYLAEIKLTMGDTKSAINLLLEARNKQGNKTLLLYQLALAYYQESRYDEAIATLKELIQQDDQHKGSWLLLGNIFYEKNLFEEAAAAYTSYLLMEPANNSIAIEKRMEEIEKIFQEGK